MANRLLKHGKKSEDLQSAVAELTKQIRTAHNPKYRLKVLFKGWGFKLPIASAVLTVFYPDKFTVYDIRVCNELGDFHYLTNLTNFESLWAGCNRYIKALQRATPPGLSLRNKDRFLWGKSIHDQLVDDIRQKFKAEPLSQLYPFFAIH